MVRRGEPSRCSTAVAAPREEFALHAELANLTTTLQRQGLKVTGNVNSGYVQRHVYHEIVAALAGARHAAGRPSTVVCETGFNAGHSALLYLLSHPSVRYLGFELEEALGSRKRRRWASRAAERLLAARFGPARVHITFGN